MAKASEAQLIMLAARKKCWAGSVKKWLLNNQPQEVAGSLLPIQPSLKMALPGFPHTMLNVKRVKHNMRLAFIEKLFTNHEIGASVQTKYLRFKSMSYKNESYLCDISCVQLRKALAQFQCGNSQLATRGNARCVEGRAIRWEALSRLQFGEGQGWKTLAPCLSKYTKSQGTFLFDPTFHSH